MRRPEFHLNIEEPGKFENEASPIAGASADNHLVNQIVIPFISRELAGTAVKLAASLSEDLHAKTTLLRIKEVPYPLPLDRPDVPPEHLLRELRDIVAESRVPVDAKLVLARDARRALRESTEPVPSS